jgi:hypothetical protein
MASSLALAYLSKKKRKNYFAKIISGLTAVA